MTGAVEERASSAADVPLPRRSLGGPNTTLLGLAALGLVINFANGVILARTLAPGPRGQAAVLIVLALLLSWLGSLGQRSSASYFIAQSGARLGPFVRGALTVVLPGATIAVLIGVAVVPIVLGGGDGTPVTAARLFMLSIVLMALHDLCIGVLAGAQRFARMGVVRILPQLLITIGYAGFELLGNGLTLERVLLITGVSYAAVVGFVYPPFFAAQWTHEEVEQTRGPGVRFGLRTTGTHIGAMVNTRLDLLMLSSYVSPATVGIYAVASNLSTIVMSLSDGLSDSVLSRAAAAAEGKARIVLTAAILATGLGLSFAAFWFVFGTPVLKAIYGSPFQEARDYAVILGVGTALLAGANLISGGVAALGRPGSVGLVQGAAALCTTVALLVVLPEYGAMGAAVVSAVMYSVIFVGVAILFFALLRTHDSHAAMAAPTSDHS